MLVGRFAVAVDDTGGFSLPGEWLFMTSDGGNLCLVPDANEKCLVLLPKTLFDDEVLRVKRSTDLNEQKQRDSIGMSCREVSVGENGRIVIPVEMREKAGILSMATLVGCVRVVKIWSSDVESAEY